MPNDLIHDDSLRAHPDGFALRLTIPWYRSLWLSAVTNLELQIDGEEVPQEDIRFEHEGHSYRIDELAAQSETLWYLQQHPLLVARRDQPLVLGEEHDIVLRGQLRLPYMQIAPGEDGGPGSYVPNHVRNALRLKVVDRESPIPIFEWETAPAPAATEEDPFQLGLTLYSASAEFRAGWYDF